MIRLKSWQWFILSSPIVSIIVFLGIASGLQIHTWGINWIWAVFVFIFVGWRWLLVKWTKPIFNDVENIILEAQQELTNSQIQPIFTNTNSDSITKLETVLQSIVTKAKEDAPIWENLQLFFQRCQELVTAIAKIYHPEVEYPLLNIYIPQAYGLIRGTVDDMDRWMTQLSPALNQITVAQAYQGYQVYRKLEPSARKILQFWNWAQWVLNPAVAAAKLASQNVTKQANQELLINLNQLLREVALRNLARQAALLYGGDTLPKDTFNPSSNQLTLPPAKTKTLQEILVQTEAREKIEQKPVKIILIGRTGAGKSSLINTLFNAQTAEVDVLPNTAEIKNYQWEATSGESLTLLDTPGYEQVNRPEYLEQVLTYSNQADIILLLNPALDPALQMDLDLIKKLPKIPIITIITQVDRLRPVREWQPPYNWQTGNLPKEISIREAVKYRQEILGEFCPQFLPIVTADFTQTPPRQSWQDEILAMNILETISPAKQLRLARFFRNLEARSLAAAKIIDKYSFQMATSQGLTALLKSPVLQFVSTLTTGSPRLALLLAEKIPVEQLPVVIGKLQLAYELFNLLSANNEGKMQFDLLSLWTLVIENNGLPENDAHALGHALVEFWTKNLSFTQLQERYRYYLKER